MEARRRYEEIVERRVADGHERAAIHELLQKTRHGNDGYLARTDEFVRLTLEFARQAVPAS